MIYLVAWGALACVTLAFFGGAGKANRRYDAEVDAEMQRDDDKVVDIEKYRRGNVTWH